MYLNFIFRTNLIFYMKLLSSHMPKSLTISSVISYHYLILVSFVSLQIIYITAKIYATFISFTIWYIPCDCQ